MFFDQVGRKPIVTRRHRSMRRKDNFARNARSRTIEIQPLILHAVSNRLQNRKAAMPFVQVQDPRRNSHRPQSAKSSYAQQQFLADSGAAISPVQTRSQFAVLGGISFHVGIEQEKIAAARFDAPDFCTNGSTSRLDFDRRGVALASNGRLDGQLVEVRAEVFFPLPAVSIQALAEISLAIK